MFHKIFSCFLVVFLSISFVSPQVLANEYMGYLNENVEYTGEQLRNSQEGEAYASQIDTFFEKNGNNSKLLDTLNERLIQTEDRIYYEENITPKTTLILLYFRAKLNVALEEIYEQEQLEKAEKVQEFFTSKVSASDTRKVQREILKLQRNMFNHGNAFIEELIGEFETYTKVQENGNLSMDVSMKQDHLLFGDEIEGNIGLNVYDYESKTNLFDSQFNGDISLDIDIASQNEGNIEIGIDTFFDIIQKDGITYVGIEDTSIQVEGSSENTTKEIEEFTNMLNTFANEEKYIRIGDESVVELFQNLKTLQPQALFGEIQVATEKPFFEAYDKNGNEYFLKPTQHLCSTLKSIAQKFDPFYGKQCSDSQYTEFLRDFWAMNGELSIIMNGTTNTLKYTASRQEADIFAQIVYNSSEIKSITIEITPDQEEYPGEGFLFEYTKGASIVLELILEESSFVANAILTAKNEIYTLNSDIHIEGKRVAFFNIDKNDITGGIDYTMKGYDWSTWEQVDTYKISMNMIGTWKNEGFEELEMYLDYTDLRDVSSYGDIELHYGKNASDAINATIEIVSYGTEVFGLSVEGNIGTEYADLQLQGKTLFPLLETMTLNLSYDLRNNASNASIHFDSSNFTLDLENTGTRKSFNGIIEAPKEYIDIEDLLPSNILY